MDEVDGGKEEEKSIEIIEGELIEKRGIGNELWSINGRGRENEIWKKVRERKESMMIDKVGKNEEIEVEIGIMCEGWEMGGFKEEKKVLRMIGKEDELRGGKEKKSKRKIIEKERMVVEKVKKGWEKVIELVEIGGERNVKNIRIKYEVEKEGEGELIDEREDGNKCLRSNGIEGWKIGEEKWMEKKDIKVNEKG